MSFKQERLAKIIEREISNIILLNTKDDRLKFVTITGVKLNTDLSVATVYFTVLGNEEQKQTTTNNLLEAKGFIKSQVSKVLEIRKMPDLVFKYDESIDYGNKIDEILKNLKS